MKTLFTHWRLLILAVFLAGVIVVGVNSIQPRPGEAEPPLRETSVPVGRLASPTASAQTGTLAQASPTPEPTVTPEPLLFTFPTPKVPVTIWRPPLYDVPWAPTPNDHFYFIRPIAADQVNWPDPTYRYGGIFFEGITHTGVDIPADQDAPVLAAGSGKVVWAGYGLYSGPDAPDDPYGLAVVIEHDFGYQGKSLFTLYAHMSRVDVIRGQYVETGQTVGHVGDTGFTTGYHLHFEVRVGENFLYASSNPELWTAPPQGWGVLVGRIMGTGGQLLYRYPVTVRNLQTRQRWTVITYGSELDVNSDPYYRENMVIGDLPAGNYQIEIGYLGRTLEWQTTIQPGQVTYFTFRGRNGFFDDPPPTPEVEFTPVAP